jgi:MinD superfamily P-loop ATPase
MKKLLILSGKGGTGKTTTAAAFIHFADARAVADCDVDAPNLHIVSKFETEPENFDFIGADKAVIDPEKCIGCGLCAEHCRFDSIISEGGVCKVDEFACEGCGVCEYICPQKAVTMTKDVAGRQSLYRGERVFSTAKLKMGRGNSGKLVTAVKAAMFKNAPDCPLAVIDGSPGIGCPVIASITGVDMVLVVSEPSKSGISDLKRLVETCRTFRTKMAVCVNKWDASPENADAIEKFCNDENIPFVGRVPYDRTASAAINSGRSLAEIDCPAGRALKLIYEKTSRLLDL